MENILAFDTSQTVLSVALHYSGRLFSRNEHLPRAQAQNILASIQAVLEEAGASLSEIDLICVGAGPGSFTGIRIAVSVAQGLAFSQGILVLPVSSLACVAQEVFSKTTVKQVMVAIDARMNEVYCGVYRYDEVLGNMVGNDVLVKPSKAVIPFSGPCALAGDAVGSINSEIAAAEIVYSDVKILPSAKFLITIAQKSEARILPFQAYPMYIREKVVIDSAD